MSDAINSHYNYVKSRVEGMNPTRKFLGVMDAEGWPPQNVGTHSFYLLDLSDKPSSKAAVSPSNMYNTTTVQWTWIIAGTQLQSGTAGRNRGDAYQINAQMKDELRFGTFPLFCEKQRFAPNGSGVMVPSSYDPKKFVDWTFPEFSKRSDRESGLIYGIATVYLIATAIQVTA